MQFDIRFDKRSQKELQKTLQKMQALTKKEMPKIIRNFTDDYVYAASYNTPLAKRVKITHKRIRDKSGQPITTAAGHSWYKVKKPRTVTPKGRGYAKLGWLKAAIGLKSFKTVSRIIKYKWSSKSKAEKISDYIDKTRGLKPYTIVTNKVPYIIGLDSGSQFNAPYHISAKSMAYVLSRWKKTISRLEKKVYSVW